jgi:hypothetical protein
LLTKPGPLPVASGGFGEEVQRFSGPAYLDRSGADRWFWNVRAVSPRTPSSLRTGGCGARESSWRRTWPWKSSGAGRSGRVSFSSAEKAAVSWSRREAPDATSV